MINCSSRFQALLGLLAMIILPLSLSAEPQPDATAYRLGPGDKIHISVFGRPDLSGAYTIRSSGKLSLPVAGEVSADNLTLPQLEARISDTYSKLMAGESGPSQAFNTNIEVLKHRPFYIMGDVSKPGSYEYESRLTVLRAIAIAGGYASSGPEAREKETRARESLNVLMSRYIAAIAREARLFAEREKLVAIPFTKTLMEMQSDPFVAEIIDIERQLFKVRRELLQQELEIIQRRKVQYKEEDRALAAQAVAVERKRKEVDGLLRGAEMLAQKGVLPKFDLASFVIMQADVERESRALIVSRSRAKQGMSTMDQEALILAGEREAEIATELENVNLELDEILLRLRAEAERLAILEVKAVTTSDTTDEKQRAAIQIMRTTSTGSVRIDAKDDTPVLAGDVISVPYQTGDVLLSLPDRTRKMNFPVPPQTMATETQPGAEQPSPGTTTETPPAATPTPEPAEKEPAMERREATPLQKPAADHTAPADSGPVIEAESRSVPPQQ